MYGIPCDTLDKYLGSLPSQIVDCCRQMHQGKPSIVPKGFKIGYRPASIFEHDPSLEATLADELDILAEVDKSFLSFQLLPYPYPTTLQYVSSSTSDAPRKSSRSDTLSMYDSNQFAPFPDEYNHQVSKRRRFVPSQKLTNLFGRSVFSRTLPKNNIWSLILWAWMTLLAFSQIKPLWENDFYIHIRMGNDILAHHRLTGDPSWVYGTGHVAWHTTMAIPEVLMALAYRVGGNTIFSLMMLVASLLILIIAWKTLRLLIPQRIPEGVVAILAITSMMVAIWMGTLFLPRPQTLSLLLFPILILWSIRFAQYGNLPKRIVLIPFTIFWVCFHGYGLLVFPVLGAGGVAHILPTLILKGEERRRIFNLALKRVKRHSLTLLFVLASTLVNPLGFGIYLASLKIRLGSHTLIQEWVPPSPTSNVYRAFVLLMIIWLLTSISFMQKQSFSSSAKMSVGRDGALLLLIGLAFIDSVRTFDLLLIFMVYITFNRIVRTFWSKGDESLEQNLFSFRPQFLLKRSRKGQFAHVGNRKLVTSIKVGVIATIMLAWGVALTNGTNLSTMGRDVIPAKLYLDINAIPGHHNILISYDISSTALAYIPNASTSLDGRVDENGLHGSQDYVHMANGKSNWKEILIRYPHTTDAIFLKNDKIVTLLQSRGWTLRGSEKTLVGGAVYEWLTPPAK